MANFGETLRQARAHKGVTLKEAEQATRINRSHLAALEDENFRALPPLIYQRGIVRNYAMYLDLDPTRLLALFDEARGDEGDTGSRGVDAVPPINMPTHWAPNFAIISFSVVLAAIVFAWTYSAFVQPPRDEAAATQIVATVTPYVSDVTLPTEPPATPVPTEAPSPSPEPSPNSVAVERIDTGRDLPSPTPTPEPTASAAEEDDTDNQLQGESATEPPATDVAEPVDMEDENNGTDNQLQGQAENEQAAELIDAIADEAPADSAASDGVYVTSLKVEALDTIELSIVADGVVVFEGTLQPGEETQFFDGSMFEVATSSGANTLFTNACGVEFNMGYEQGQAFYPMPADADSCAPVGN